jgi:phosphatidylglycerol:prolipoprotein diacylglycerol transferase
MRPRIVDWLANLAGMEWAERLVPAPATFYTLCLLAMLVVFVRRGRPRLGSGVELAATAFWGMVGGIAGARIFFATQHGMLPALLDWKYALSGLGTASWGAYLGAAAGLALAQRLHGRPILPILDLGASVAGLGIAIGRLSCFLAGDDYGTTTSVPWAVRFPQGSLPYAGQLAAGTLSPEAALSHPVHPVQHYLALNGLLLFAAATQVWRRQHDRPGLTLAGYLTLYSTTRFALEFFRGDQTRYSPLHLSVPQLMSAATLAACLVGAAAWRDGRLGGGQGRILAPSGEQKSTPGIGRSR